MLWGGNMSNKNIIIFTTKGREKHMNVLEFEEKLRNANQRNETYSLENIENWAELLWHECGLCDEFNATPIVKIAKLFNFAVFQTDKLQKEYDGTICVNCEGYVTQGYEKLILIDSYKELFQQRFVVAHELGHYLFEYLGSELEKDNIEFVRPYRKNNHEDLAEQQANRFASCILMPKKIFAAEYNKLLNQNKDQFFIIRYLSRYFQVKEESVKIRVREVFKL